MSDPGSILEWSAVRYRDNEILPSGRWGHSLTIVTQRYLLVIGGELRSALLQRRSVEARV